MNSPAAFSTEPVIQELPDQHFAVVRDTVPFDGIPALYDRAFPLLFETLGAAGLAPAGPPMGIMHGAPSPDLDLSVAVPLAVPYPAQADANNTPETVRGETLPAARVATLAVRGDYAQLAGAYERLYAWIAAAGETAGDIAWEQYLTEPEPGGDPAANETLLGVLLR